jgi:hypothetical protein
VVGVVRFWDLGDQETYLFGQLAPEWTSGLRGAKGWG